MQSKQACMHIMHARNAGNGGIKSRSKSFLQATYILCVW